MTTSIAPLRNSKKMLVIDERGVEVEIRDYINTPFQHFFPDEPACIIDWLAAGNNRPDEEKLRQPVTYQGPSLSSLKGTQFYGNLAWGSMVKMGKTIGLAQDLGVQTNAFVNVEDGQRFQRWMMGQGIWGGIVVGGLKVGIVRPHTYIDGAGPVEDGFGYAKREVVEKGYNNLPKIKLGKAKGSYTFWQRVRPWTRALENELLPLIYKRLEAYTEMKGLLFDQHASWDEKREYYHLDNEMIYHPYIANALNRSNAELFARAATTVPLGQYMRLAVPTICNKFAIPGLLGKFIGLRYPMDSDSSAQAASTDEEDPGILKSECERIAKLEAVQVSMSSKELMIKGMLGVVEDLPNGWDIVICTEDIKMASAGLKDTRQLAELDFSGVLSFTQWFAAGSCAGVRAEWAKDILGLDHDGDMIEVNPCNDLPILWQTVRDLPPAKTPKLNKTHRKIVEGDFRTEMICKSMSNLVGFATNVVSDSFEVADRAFLAGRQGFSSETEYNEYQNFFIKAGTDGPKTDIDLIGIEKQVAAMQTNQIKILTYGAPWTNWPNEQAFKHECPVVIDQVLPTKVKDEIVNKYIVAGEIIFMSKDQLKNAVHPFMDGTIAQICRLTLPHLKNIIGETVKVEKLTRFRNWAPEVSGEVLAGAKSIQDWYNANQARVAWHDPRSVGAFKLRFFNELEAWITENDLDREEAAAGLWRVAHSSRSTEAGAASVFIAFPEACKRFVSEKPGVPQVLATVLTGVHYQVPGLVTADNLSVTVVDVHINQKGKTVIRKAIVGVVDGQVQPQNMQYPANMIGLIAENSDQPDLGTYKASIKQHTQASWVCHLSPI